MEHVHESLHSNRLFTPYLQAINSGIHVVVSAGNADLDSDSQSPARAHAAIVVGATDINDAKADFSNWGPGVDIFAPGVNVIAPDQRG